MIIFWTPSTPQNLKDTVGLVMSHSQASYRVDTTLTHLPDATTQDLIVVMGKKALDSLKSMFPELGKSKTINNLRGSVFVLGGYRFLVTFDANIIQVDYSKVPEIIWDTRLAERVVLTGTTEPTLGMYSYVPNFNNLVNYVLDEFDKTGKPVRVACDLETKGLQTYDPNTWIMSIAFTYIENESDVMRFPKSLEISPRAEGLYWRRLWGQIKWLLTTDKIHIMGANFKYDMLWIKEKWGIDCTNFKVDTVLLGSLLDENRSNSLKLHAKIYTDKGGYEHGLDNYDMGALEEVPDDTFLKYAGADTDATFEIANKMRAEVSKDARLTKFYVNLLNPASVAFTQLESNGVCLDLEYMKELQSELETESSILQSKLVDHLPSDLKNEFADDIRTALKTGKNPMKPSLIKAFLFSNKGLGLKPIMTTPKTGEPATSMEHLMHFKGHKEASKFIGDLSALGSVSKTLSTYVIGFLKHVRDDGKLHPTYMLFKGAYGDSEDSGTNTGRTSAKDPAIQTIPKHSAWAKKLRRAYVAPDGMSILNVDYSQGELRICADVADEPTMIKAYNNDADLHVITASGLLGLSIEEFKQLPPEIQDEARSGGKAGNFGLLYGMSANGFKEYAYATYGVDMSSAEAVAKRNAFFSLYSKLPEWHEYQKATAKKYGYVRSPLGRIRHLPLINSNDFKEKGKAERQSINSVVQSTLSDLMMLSMHYIQQEYGNQIKMFMMTHDSNTLYVPTEDRELWASRIIDILENLPLQELFGWTPKLKFKADAEVGDNLADLVKVKI